MDKENLIMNISWLNHNKYEPYLFCHNSIISNQHNVSNDFDISNMIICNFKI